MSEAEGAAAAKAQSAPHPDDPRKPDSPDELHKPSWKYTLKKSLMEFSRDQCTDSAAGLTYFAVLSLFPALLALISLLGVFGQGTDSVNKILDIGGQFLPASSLDQIRPVVESMVQTQAAGFALVTGLLVALWSASNYVNAFSRAMNRVYEVDEGRPMWKLRPLILALTLVILLLVCLVLVGLVVSGPVAQTVGDLLGMGGTAVTIWNIAKWPVILVVVIIIVALLYHVTPNIQQPKFRWISVGAVIALLVWGLASAAFGFYVANFGSYNKTYGSLAGIIVFLLWLWITNNALLFGAEVDAEMERARQLQAGIKAEETIQLPPRDTKQSEKAAKKRQEAIESGRQIRLEAEAHNADSSDEAQAPRTGSSSAKKKA
ncbi:YihY/virulence factor BrkB family protein [Gephyromycinifex aptenodytis]|uniref:YihY/virulence factor BrkB family protein n=1 Tax=Gephyromycinifex aptenodytis TaxID=2716227 RepID=UPI001446C524|nr:YihY/virulence factor BrkB family protein [Gephyromycinifex aptenodytis]